MKLADLAAGAKAVAVVFIGDDAELAREVQQRLADVGLVDPPPDGVFGPVSHWGIGELLRKLRLERRTWLDADLAQRLLDPQLSQLFPLKVTATLAGRIVAAMQRKGYWICRHPDCINIVYVEGMDPDGTPNIDAPNVFNDARFVLRVRPGGIPEIIGAWDATTEPGAYYTAREHWLDPHGPARIAFGQYKAWTVGTHMRGKPQAHEALVQVAPLVVHRDFNQDFERTGDTQFTNAIGINQHWGFDQNRENVAAASAGCLVGRTRAGHREFMQMVKADPRYQVNHGYRFLTTVVPAAQVVPHD